MCPNLLNHFGHCSIFNLQHLDNRPCISVAQVFCDFFLSNCHYRSKPRIFSRELLQGQLSRFFFTVMRYIDPLMGDCMCNFMIVGAIEEMQEHLPSDVGRVERLFEKAREHGIDIEVSNFPSVRVPVKSSQCLYFFFVSFHWDSHVMKFTSENSFPVFFFFFWLHVLMLDFAYELLYLCIMMWT